MRGVQQFAKGQKQLVLWKICYTDSKAMKTSPVDLSPVAVTEGATAAAVQEKSTWLVSGATGQQIITQQY